MRGLNIATRKLSTSRRILREKGPAALASAVSRQLNLKIRLFLARKVKSIELDGCRFDLTLIPPSPMKLEMLRGKYEAFERRALRHSINPDLPLIELGGCIGVLACISNRFLANPQAHVVVEANPHVIPLLAENRRQNQCQFEFVNAAIAYDRPSVTFSPAIDLWANSLHQHGGGAAVTVDTICLRDIVEGRGFDRFNLICDIEGCEFDLLMHEPEILQKADSILLETHACIIGEDKTRLLLDSLRKFGFQIVEEDADVLVMNRRAARNLTVSSL